jgi:hypothetical protein
VPRNLTRVLRVPEWLDASHVPYEPIPRERRSSERPLSDGVFWASTSSAGLRAFGVELAWTRAELRAVRLLSVVPGWVEIRLLWSGAPDWATLLAREPWSDAEQERYGALALELSKLLDVPFETAGAADA